MDLLNTTGTCSACGGKVKNIDSMRGCSLEKLEKRHAVTCPGITRRKESAK